MRNGVGVANVDGAVGQNGAEERADDALGLVRPPHVTVADVEYDKRMNLRRDARR